MTAERLEGTQRYGTKYFCVGVPKMICPTRQIYVNADRIEINTGALICWGGFRQYDHVIVDSDVINLAFAPGHWTYVFAASVIDGSAVAVDHWEGEVSR